MIRRILVSLVLVFLVGTAASTTGCKRSKKKAPTPSIASIEGVAALPSGLEVVVGVDVKRVASSGLVARAINQLFARDPQLQRQIAGLLEACQIDPAVDLSSALIGTATQPGGAGAAIETLLVVSGRFDEANLAACLGKYMSGEGGTLTSRDSDGRTIYQAAGARTVWFAFGSATTVVVSASEVLLQRALGTTPRLSQDPEMAALLGLANREAAFWGVGKLDQQVGQGLIRASGGALEAPPKAVIGSFDPADGASFSLAVVMVSEEQANILKELVESQIGALAVVLQGRGLGSLAAKVEVTTSGDKLRLAATLSTAEVSELLSRIDMGGTSEEDAGPAKQE